MAKSKPKAAERTEPILTEQNLDPAFIYSIPSREMEGESDLAMVVRLGSDPKTLQPITKPVHLFIYKPAAGEQYFLKPAEAIALKPKVQFRKTPAEQGIFEQWLSIHFVSRKR